MIVHQMATIRLRTQTRGQYPKDRQFVSNSSDDLLHNQKALWLPERKEILGDFIALAREAHSEGQKEIAAVFVCAALEDSPKQCATSHALDVHHKEMPVVVHAQWNALDISDLTDYGTSSYAEHGGSLSRTEHGRAGASIVLRSRECDITRRMTR